MKTQTNKAMPPRSLRRNRRLLGIAAVIVLPALGWTMGRYAMSHEAGPLLMSVDQIKTSESEHRSIVAPSMNDSASPSMPVVSSAASLSEAVASLPMPLPPSAKEPLPVGGRSPMSVTPSAAGEVDFDHESMRWFNGRPIRPSYTLSMVVTAYSPDERSCAGSADGITASGYSVWTNGMKSAAADTSVLPFGSLISVPGYDDGGVVPVLDRGGAIKGKRLDMLFATDALARKWGTQRLSVTVWEYADGKPNDFKTCYTGAARAN